MSDIVEQLRTEAEVTAGAGGGSLLERAADEIERLRAENQRLREGIVHLGFWNGDHCNCTGEDPPCPLDSDFYTQPSDAECENKRLKEVSDRMARELRFMADEIVRLRARYVREYVLHRRAPSGPRPMQQQSLAEEGGWA